MKITQSVRDDIVILTIQGKLAGTIGGGTGLSEHILESLTSGDGARGGTRHRVLLDLNACTGADSLGIGELISLHVSLANRGGALKLLHLPIQIRDLLQATQLISMFEIHEGEGGALGSFG